MTKFGRFSSKILPALEFFFRTDILLQNFRAKSVLMKMAHPRIPHYGKCPPPRMITSCLPACVEKLITLKPLLKGQRWDPVNVRCPPNLRNVGEKEIFSFFEFLHQQYMPCYKIKRKYPLVTNFEIIAIFEIDIFHMSAL